MREKSYVSNISFMSERGSQVSRAWKITQCYPDAHRWAAEDNKQWLEYFFVELLVKATLVLTSAAVSATDMLQERSNNRNNSNQS